MKISYSNIKMTNVLKVLAGKINLSIRIWLIKKLWG